MSFKKSKEFIKLLLPPFILLLIQKIRGTKRINQNITYEGFFDSFSDVKMSYGNIKNYHTIESEGETLREGERALKRVKNNLPPNDGMALIRHNFLPIFISGFEKENINILDIGGGCATAYVNCKYSCPNISVKSTVIELERLIPAFEKIFLNEEVNFISAISDVNSKEFDVINFGSSLQYFENYNPLLIEVANLRAQYIVISDTPIGGFKTFVCAQVNMRDNVIPRLVFGFDDLNQILSSNGYSLIHRSINYYPFHNFDNYSPPISDAKHMNIIYKRYDGK